MVRIGSSFDSYLRSEDALEATHAVAIERVSAWRISDAMTREGISKAEMARRVRTSRSQLDRLLDPENDAVGRLEMLARAAQAVGRRLKLELV